MKYLLVWLIFLSSPLRSQNLVPNPGFEEFEKCPGDFTVKYREELVPGWYMPSKGTADYFNGCTKRQVGVPQNFMGYCLPKEGMAYAGIILLLEPPKKTVKSNQLINYREYLQTELKKPLEKNTNYEITFYYSVASYSTFAINRIGVYLSEKKISDKRTSGVMKYEPQIFADTLEINSEINVWYLFKSNYRAMGGEKFLTIGNFYDDNHTKFKACDLTGLSAVKKSKVIGEQISYYYIDSVSVVRMDAQ